MKNRINVAKILKDCPKDMPLDSTMYEDVYFDYVHDLNTIHCYIQNQGFKTTLVFNQFGTPNSNGKSKCVIFPKGKTTWEGFVPPCVHKIDFKPFDKILVRDHEDCIWRADFYSHCEHSQSYCFVCVGNTYKQCIPYNKETAHLLSTDHDCPNKYKIWKDE